MTLRIFKARFNEAMQLVKKHSQDADVPEPDYKFAYAVIKAQLSVKKHLKEACLAGELTPALLEDVIRECGGGEYVHIIHTMSAEEDDFQELRGIFREIAHLWYK